MHILLLTHQGGIAGSTLSISYLAKGLAKKGHQVFVGCPATSYLYKILQGTSVHLLPMTFRNKTDRNNMRQIRDAVQSYGIQLINAQSGIDRYTSIFARLFYGVDVPLIHTRRQTPKSIGTALQNWFYTRFTDRIVAISQGIKNSLVDIGLPERHITVIRNGTPPEKYEHIETSLKPVLQKTWSIDPHDYVVGCVSRRKQQEQLLEAGLHLKTRVTFFFIGIKAEKQYQKIIDRFIVPHRVIFAGTIPPNEILNYYQLFNVHVLPSITEGYSQSLLEAMALGVPVLATRAAGNIDVIDENQNGLLFGDRQTQELAAKLEQLIHSEPLRQRLIPEARRKAIIESSIQKTIDNYENFYEEIIRSYRRPAKISQQVAAL